MRKIIAALVVCYLGVCSCTMNSHEVQPAAIEPWLMKLQDDSLTIDQSHFYSCISVTDTLVHNINGDFNSVMARISHSLDSISQLQFNHETRTYLKCLLLTDFTSSLFSGQFLGNKLGMSDHSVSISSWNDRTIKECFDHGNRNVSPVWCGDRTTFFIKLADSLLHIKATQVSVPGIHTYPLITIGQKQFIFDPYDLFVPMDTIDHMILDYQAIKSEAYRSICVYDVKPEFGKRKELVSDRFINMLRSEYGKEKPVCALLENYFNVNGKQLLEQSTICKRFRLHRNLIEVHPVVSDDCSYVLTSDVKIGSTKHDIPNFYRQYFGRSCN